MQCELFNRKSRVEHHLQEKFVRHLACDRLGSGTFDAMIHLRPQTFAFYRSLGMVYPTSHIAGSSADACRTCIRCEPRKYH